MKIRETAGFSWVSSWPPERIVFLVKFEQLSSTKLQGWVSFKIIFSADTWYYDCAAASECRENSSHVQTLLEERDQILSQFYASSSHSPECSAARTTADLGQHDHDHMGDNIWLYRGWQKLNPQSQPNATLAPQIRQARASGEILNYLLSQSDILLYDHMGDKDTDLGRGGSCVSWPCCSPGTVQCWYQPAPASG